MSSPSAQVIFVPVLFTCQRGNEVTRATQYIAVPAFSTMDDVRAAAREVLAELLAGERGRFADSLPGGADRPLVCGFEILPITAIPR